MKIEIGSECREKELKRGSVEVVAAAAVVVARQLFGWLGEEDCRLHLEVTDVPIKLSSALLLHSLLFFYSRSHEYNGSIMLPCMVSCIFLAGVDTKHCTRSVFPTWDLEVKHIVSPGPKLKGVPLQKAAFLTSYQLTRTHTTMKQWQLLLPCSLFQVDHQNEFSETLYDCNREPLSDLHT